MQWVTALVSFNAFIIGLIFIYIGLQVHPLQNAPDLTLWGETFVNYHEPLFGKYLLPSLGVIITASAPLIFVVYWLRQKGADWFTLILFAVAAIISLHYIHISRNDAGTNDWDGHIARSIYISTHWLDPFGYNGWQKHHPVGYYYLAAGTVWISELFNIPVLLGLRFFSWLCYLIFNAYGLLTLRLLRLSDTAYRLSMALFLLWPAGIHLASKINNELLFYPLYMASFYYIAWWWRDGEQRLLRTAWILAGIALLAKSNAGILFLIMPILMGIAWRQHRIRLHDLFTRPWLRIGALMLICVLINQSFYLRQWIEAPPGTSYFELSKVPIVGPHIPGGLSAMPRHFLLLNYHQILHQPFNNWSAGQSFWNFLLKTAIFGEYKWAMPGIALYLDVLLMLLTLFICLPWLFAQRNDIHGLAPFAVGLILPLACLMAFGVKGLVFPCEDFRYIYPSIVSIAVLYGRSHMLLQRHGAVLAAWLGTGIAIVFVTLGAGFFWMNGL